MQETRTSPSFHQTAAGCHLAGAEHAGVPDSPVPIGLQLTRPRVLPWLRVARVPQFGRGLDGATLDRTLEALVHHAREAPLLRLHVEPWSEDPEACALVGDACARQGLRPAARRRSPGRTLWIDLAPDEDTVFAAFHATARRHIRAPGKRGFCVRTVEDPEAVPVLQAILEETFARTGGRAPAVAWDVALSEQARTDGRVRIMGLYPEGASGPEALAAFAMAVLHDDVAEYAHAGSRRLPELRMPLLYAPTWSLMQWARDRGARLWDFGGIGGDHETPEAPAAGISTFKRYFNGRESNLGPEWVLEPRPRIATVEQVVHRFLARLR